MKKTVRVLSGIVAVVIFMLSAIVVGSADGVEKHWKYKGVGLHRL